MNPNEKNLTVVPLVQERVPSPEPPYLPTAMAMEQNRLRVEEGSGDNLRIVNLGDIPVLIAEHEVFEGGHQDRTARLGTYVPARGQVSLQVFCVEKGRSRGPTPIFSLASYGLPFAVRVRKRGAIFQEKDWNKVTITEKKYYINPYWAQIQDVYCPIPITQEEYEYECNISYKSPQHEVWEGIESALHQHHVAAPTQRLGALYEQLKTTIDPLVQSVPLVPNQVGFVLLEGSELMGIEWVAHPLLWQAYHQPLLRSYLLSSVERVESLEVAEEPGVLEFAPEFRATLPNSLSEYGALMNEIPNKLYKKSHGERISYDLRVRAFRQAGLIGIGLEVKNGLSTLSLLRETSAPQSKG